jgi:hypothetical protein
VADIFVSYTSSDREWAFWIGQQLESIGHTPHVHEWEISGGGDILAWMEQYHDKASQVLCVVSEAYLKAPYSALERRAAQWAAITKRPNFVLPVFIQACEAPTLFAVLRRCDLHGLSEGDARERLEVFLAPPVKPAGPVPFPGATSQKRSFISPLDPSIAFPGNAYAVSNVPINVPLHFLGRDEELAAIDRALKERPGRAVLYGLRGVGKTTLAAAYAERHRQDYSVTWWIRAVSGPSLRADLVGLGVRQQWVAANESEQPALNAVMARLRDEGADLLLIYDNALDLASLRQFLPPSGSAARVLITSNDHAWRSAAKPLAIELWSIETGAKYLMERAGRPDGRAAAEELSKVLEGLPLAHEQSAAYCERLEISLEEYRRRFVAEPLPLLRDPRVQTEYGMTVAKTFALAIDEAAKIHAGAEPLIMYAALLAPEPIPLFFFDEGSVKLGEPLASAAINGELSHAVATLRAFALIDRETIADERDSSIETECIRLHRLVRLIAGERWNEEMPGRNLSREAALANVVSAFALLYPKNVRENPRVWRLFPHVVRVLETLVKDHAESEARDYLDELIRLVVMALRVTEDQQRAGNLIPDYLATVLGDFYVVELLKKPIGLLIEKHPDAWPGLQVQFLRTNNYVIRYAMAHALADAYRNRLPLVTITGLAALVLETETVNEFELGGYALNLIYARDPSKIDLRVLTQLAKRREYCGRSILGDLVLNLVFRKEATLHLRGLLDSDRFWRPIWDFIAVDIRAIEAAEFFMSSPRPAILLDVHPETKQDFDSFVMIEADKERFLKSATRNPALVELLDRYFSLGQDTESISKAEDQFANLPHADLQEIIRLLFAHPIWAVAEAAAAMLSLLVERDKALIAIVGELLDNANWRVRYGACEAAFILREKFPEIFFGSVHRFFDDLNCKIRGLCAENLFSYILNASSAARPDRIKQFEKEIHRWTADEDCWVLEHVFRFFHTLSERYVDIAIFLSGPASRLLAGKEEWYLLEREQFLLHIEQRKEELVNSPTAARAGNSPTKT